MGSCKVLQNVIYTFEYNSILNLILLVLPLLITKLNYITELKNTFLNKPWLHIKTICSFKKIITNVFHGAKQHKFKNV